MKKAILCLLYSLCYTLAPGQSADALQKGEAARARMVQAFGGEQALGQARHLSYTLVRTTASGDTSHTLYTLDLEKRHIRTSTQTASGTEVRSIDATSNWKSINGKREELSAQEAAALQRTFFFNFIPMLQNRQLQYTFLRAGTYQGRPVDIVRVEERATQNPLTLDLFIDQQNGQVLTSSRSDSEGRYPYFADELVYEPVGLGVIFPLVYKMVVEGEVTSVGEFKDVTLSK
ncbi:hypothetical protein [Pontibacter chinhatensis]|uniref:Outer membrane lipoprotein-sorting protein n=1 Tax=Pontibacter chinhatensis TaxID=1436961 RepID=A0A1I2RU68_9BACT|nr:hypothetical protein [Pontibacter chinhatensis]SFG44245.1 hypothetical protein SAMN05421739_102539 [Pontibacter chinhatensis]